MNSLTPQSMGPPFCPGGMLVRPYYGGVQVVHPPIEFSFVVVVLALERLQDAFPYSSLLPAVEAACNSPPRTVAFGKVAPGSSGAIYPENAVYDAPMICVGSAGWWLLRWQVWLQTFPLLVGQISTSHTDSVPTSRQRAHIMRVRKQTLVGPDTAGRLE